MAIELSLKRAAAKYAQLLAERLVHGGKILGQDYVVRNPTRDDKNAGSFKICVKGRKSGLWIDYATGDKGSNLFSLAQYVKGCSLIEAEKAVREILDNRGIASAPKYDVNENAENPPTDAEAAVKPSDDETIAAPADAEPWQDAIRRLYGKKPDHHWPYRTAAGSVAFYIFRWDEAGGRKTIRPMSYCRSKGGEGWELKAWPNARPLYGLNHIEKNPTSKIVVCEGEKAADEAETIFGRDYVTTTSSGGAGALRKTDWKPLSGRTVLIWPDADEPGQKYADEVTQILQDLGCIVSIIDAMALAATAPSGEKRSPEKGWDAADAIGDWADRHALRATIASLTKSATPRRAYLNHGRFTMTADGLKMKVSSRSSNADNSKEVMVCAAFEVKGKSRNSAGSGWGTWIRFDDRDGRSHQRHVPDADLQDDRAEFCKVLADAGLPINPNERRSLREYLGGILSEKRATLVNRTGWYQIAGQWCFVLGDEVIGSPEGEHVVLDASAAGPYATQGLLREWRASIGQDSCHHLLVTLAISAAFAGPLAQPAKAELGGINFFGGSSTGKTTLLQCAASVWGRGSKSGGFVKGWSATANGLEGIAASTNDTLLVLDELGVLEGHAANAAIYGLANGAGKSRMARDTSLRESKTWRIVTLSSGEIPMAVKIAEGRGQKARAGQKVRMLDIPADRGRGFGAFSSTKPESNAGALADRLKAAAETTYGTAGPEFVRRLVRAGVEKAGRIAERNIGRFVEDNVPEGADGQVGRAAKLFGLIGAAGEMAAKFDIVPWSDGQSTKAASWAFKQWMIGRGGVEAAEVRAAIEQVRLFIEAHGDSRFDSQDPREVERAVNNRAGWRSGSGDHREWYVPPEVWKSEICHGLDPIFVAKTLFQRGMLIRAKDGFQKVVKIEGASKRVYVITSRIFAAEGGDLQ